MKCIREALIKLKGRPVVVSTEGNVGIVVYAEQELPNHLQVYGHPRISEVEEDYFTIGTSIYSIAHVAAIHEKAR